MACDGLKIASNHGFKAIWNSWLIVACDVHTVGSVILLLSPVKLPLRVFETQILQNMLDHKLQ